MFLVTCKVSTNHRYALCLCTHFFKIFKNSEQEALRANRALASHLSHYFHYFHHSLLPGGSPVSILIRIPLPCSKATVAPLRPFCAAGTEQSGSFSDVSYVRPNATRILGKPCVILCVRVEVDIQGIHILTDEWCRRAESWRCMKVKDGGVMRKM